MAEFIHDVIDTKPPCEKLGFCLTTDLTQRAAGRGREVARTAPHFDVWYNEG